MCMSVVETALAMTCWAICAVRCILLLLLLLLLLVLLAVLLLWCSGSVKLRLIHYNSWDGVIRYAA
eukprot:COSAG02_NODE_4267_length_5568_cov_2.810752_1_plen_66_part_00